MRNLIKIISKNPELIRINTYEEKAAKERYESSIHHDKLFEIAKEYAQFAKDIHLWRVDHQTIEENFNFGIKIARELRLGSEEIEKLFNDYLYKFFDGGCIGFFISGIYHEIIKKQTTLKLNLTPYKTSVSGIGYWHPDGKLQITGDKAYHIGMQMRGGEIHVFGNPGNHIGTEMRGGLIIVYGNGKNFIGEKMENGTILIKGNAQDVIGILMKGGEIIIEGEAGHWIGNRAKGGKIKIGTG